MKPIAGQVIAGQVIDGRVVAGQVISLSPDGSQLHSPLWKTPIRSLNPTKNLD